MKGTDIFLFLFGHRGAIERIAGSWWSLLVAVVLVLTAGIARNYDHLDLLRNPEWIWGPFAASAVTSVLVFAVVFGFVGLGKVTESGKTGFFSFLCIYWMTAPCAWLYAIPVEACTDLVTATAWNILFLAIVSVWRVFLVTRSLAVLTGAGVPTCLVAVLFPSSVIMCVGSLFKSLSLVGIMGGVRLPPHTELLVSATSVLMVLSFWTAVILLVVIIAMVVFNLRRTAGRALPWRKEKAPRVALKVAALVVLGGLLVAVPVQVKMMRNHRLAGLLEQGSYREAIEYASQFERDDFSSIHYLPPDPFRVYGGSPSHYRKLLPMLGETVPGWLREVWMDQYAELILAAKYGVGEEDYAVVAEFPGLRQRFEEEAGDRTRKEFEEFLDDTSSTLGE